MRIYLGCGVVRDLLVGVLLGWMHAGGVACSPGGTSVYTYTLGLKGVQYSEGFGRLLFLWAIGFCNLSYPVVMVTAGNAGKL